MRKLKTLGLLFFTVLLLSSNAFAQRNCSAMDLLDQQIQQDPNRAAQIQQMEQQIASFATQDNNQRGGVITIPVVFHVIHDGQAVGTDENISDAMVYSQLDVLNEDFRRTNADAVNTVAAFQSVAADCMIEFCMASVDPQGNVTNGIDRYDGGQANWSNTSSFDNTIKPATSWNPNNYLNYWIVDFGNNGLLGYATFPGGSANQDGVVCGYQNIGRPPANPYNNAFNLGRTGTHEVGHWLGLYHTFQSGCGNNCASSGDFVCDTPPVDQSNSGCPTTHQSCGDLDMVQNYMDYTDDDCMNVFSQGQATRMLAVLNGTRLSIQSSPACQSIQQVSVSGQVVDSVSGQGIENAKVRFVSGGLETVFTTDQSGNFSSNTFVEGTYEIYAGKWGHVTRQHPSTFITTGTPAINIELAQGYYDDFVIDLGWSVSGNASTGRWEIGNPVGTSYNGAESNPEDDMGNDLGTDCYVTGNDGGSVGNDDIDDGRTTLTSPVFDISGYGTAMISYNTWFFNDGGNGTPNDSLLVMIHNGSTSAVVELINSASTQSQWINNTITVSDFVTPSANMTMTLMAGDQDATGHLVEAGLDVFEVWDDGSVSGPCQTVSGLHETHVTPTSAVLNWTVQPNASHYRIRGRRQGSTGYVYITIASGTTTSKLVQGLVSNAIYEWEIRAFCDPNENTISDWSGLSSFTTKCQTPMNTTTINVTSSSATLSWDQVAGAIGYEIRGRIVGGSTWVHLSVGGGFTTHRDVSGLQPNTSYQWGIKSLCDQTGVSQSTYSTTTSFNTANNTRLSQNFKSVLDKVTVFPNPASDFVNVQFGEAAFADGSVSILNFNGQSLSSTTVSGMASQKLDISSLASGIYFLEVRVGEDQRIFKISKY